MEAVVKAQDRFKIIAGTLLPMLHEDRTLFEASLICAADRRNGSEVVIRSSIGGPPHPVVVVPLVRALPPGHPGPCQVLIMLGRKGPGMSPARLLARMFGLTGAEARLTLALASGKDLRESADGTVRQQVRSIFAKTMTRRRSELVALIGSLPTAWTMGQNR